MSYMRRQCEQRLADLQQEFASGRQMLADLQARQAELERTLLRISGAMQVLEELLALPEPASNGVSLAVDER